MDFLVRRPIAVIMAFLALFIVGAVSYNTLPVSMLPNIDIPQITVKMSDPNLSARELENSVVSVVRRQLLQIGGMQKIESQVRDGIGVIKLHFKFGTNTNLAYIEVNERIDDVMNSLPQGTQRPVALKSNATDIPVFYLNITLKNSQPYAAADNKDAFLELCDVVDNVIRRRIEQLEEVAMADVTGVPGRRLLITPDERKMAVHGLTTADIEAALSANNVDAGSMTIRDGYYEYAVRTTTLLRNVDDVADIYMRSGERLIQLKDVCNVSLESNQEEGLAMANGKRAVTVAVIKQSSEGMDKMLEHIDGLVKLFRGKYPQYDFEVSRNQTQLLNYTIDNLSQNLWLGFLLIIIVGIIFMGNVRSALVVVVCMAVAVVVTFVPFYFFGKSLNIVSLSGLILVVGMMIDNALIVCENISQWRQRGLTLRAACVRGTSELISPLLSSSLTTVSVFAPLVFISGMAGTMFGDQAFTITAGLAVSYVVGIILLPVIYKLIFTRQARKGLLPSTGKMSALTRAYDKGYEWCNRRQLLVILFTLLTIPLCYVMFRVVEKSKMPYISQTELVAQVDWNEPLTLSENAQRTLELLQHTDLVTVQSSAAVGAQDYVVDATNRLSKTEAELYWKCGTPQAVDSLQRDIAAYLAGRYPTAIISFAPPATIFEKLFSTAEPDVVAMLQYKGAGVQPEELNAIEQQIKQMATGVDCQGVAFKPSHTVLINRQALALYRVRLERVEQALRQAIDGNRIALLHNYNSYIPIFIGGASSNIDEVILRGTVMAENRTPIPVRQLVSVVYTNELKTISAGKDGEYIPLQFYKVADAEDLCRKVRSVTGKTVNWDVDFMGAFFANQLMIKELVVVLMISLLLMYFILCAQFESFKQPLIVLAEIPIDASAALVVLWLCGHTLNLMSAIGIIVTCGIVINDSILKIDTINVLRKGGMALDEAVHQAGRRRLRAIVMTSLTTIGAVVPVLFTDDIGSQLQAPLAIAMIATMTLGTMVSLFVIPLIYQQLERKR